MPAEQDHSVLPAPPGWIAHLVIHTGGKTAQYMKCPVIAFQVPRLLHPNDHGGAAIAVFLMDSTLTLGYSDEEFGIDFHMLGVYPPGTAPSGEEIREAVADVNSRVEPRFG